MLGQKKNFENNCDRHKLFPDLTSSWCMFNEMYFYGKLGIWKIQLLEFKLPGENEYSEEIFRCKRALASQL